MNGFTFFGSYYEALKKMNDEDRLQAFDALCRYAIEGEESEDLSSVAEMFMILVKPNVDSNIRAREGAKNGGRPKKPEVSQTEKPGVSESEKPEVLENENPGFPEAENRIGVGEGIGVGIGVGIGDREGVVEGEVQGEGTKRKRFTPPTPEEVRDYCLQNGYGVDPDRFVDFYTSKGWKVGSSPMKDWKAAVRNWAKKEPVARSGTYRGSGMSAPQYKPTSSRTQEEWYELERQLILSQRGTG